MGSAGTRLFSYSKLICYYLGRGVMLNSFTVAGEQTRCRDCGSRRLKVFMQIYYFCLSCGTLQAEIEKVKGENTDRSEKSGMPDFGFGNE